MRPTTTVKLTVLWMKAWACGRTFRWASEEANQRVLDSMFTRLSLATSGSMGRQIAFDAYQRALENGDLILVPRPAPANNQHLSVSQDDDTDE